MTFIAPIAHRHRLLYHRAVKQGQLVLDVQPAVLVEHLGRQVPECAPVTTLASKWQLQLHPAAFAETQASAIFY
eukprot:scaffold109495_cov26-Tisochrysis_lutea.AAC.6